MTYRFPLLFIGAAAWVHSLAPAAGAQDPLSRYSDAFEAQVTRTQPVIHYTVAVDPEDLSAYRVEMRVRNAPDTLRFALAIWAPGAYRVPGFSKWLRDLAVRSGDRGVSVSTVDSSSWRAVVEGGEATVSYKVGWASPAVGSTPNNRSFLTGTGGLVDGPATFVYLAGSPAHKLVPAHVTFDLPDGWRIATGLIPTADPRTFFAPSYDVLVDSPTLIGALRIWMFGVDGVPHRVAYWPRPNAAPFDTVAFVASAERVVRTAREIFGRLPYREYTFLYVDGAGGGLEHLNSTTIGARSETLAVRPAARLGVTAHEYVHTWNVKRARPFNLGPFDYQRIARSNSLWFSEGMTSFFSAEIQRRGFWTEEQAKASLATSIAEYLGNPAHTRISPARSSWTTWDPPAVNGGYSISYYLTGALIGEMLELKLRDATGTRRGMDDVMHRVFDRYAAARGFTDAQLEATIAGVCGCSMRTFFTNYVTGTRAFDFDRYLALAGWKAVVERRPATDSTGALLADRRLRLSPLSGFGSSSSGGIARATFSVADPSGVWGRAGLATGDVALTVNGRPVATADQLTRALAEAKIGDVVPVEYERAGTRRTVQVTLTGYDVVRVRIDELASVTPRQLAVRRVWMTGP